MNRSSSNLNYCLTISAENTHSLSLLGHICLSRISFVCLFSDSRDNVPHSRFRYGGTEPYPVSGSTGGRREDNISTRRVAGLTRGRHSAQPPDASPPRTHPVSPPDSPASLPTGLSPNPSTTARPAPLRPSIPPSSTTLAPPVPHV